uniref:Methyltransferase small domain-containing protein n=1 Tax=Chromera velia CCMP2878 TaxID=1169474 RepID=A0A0G4HYQ2_9ALVE|eukprot:Cvel_9549.t1-p1 / transcript=Cvel_9549.t1 / gene=Cvel_9549 / organism=Chromera_velia_CCMP2878 / gene_product=hypothetical protein / transcript_product=hypothetical protein / location=Cvel_scaffold553:39656-42091(-) / protein_length=329 / sequence_SO=supercontig / SO=protein_coding / is_pseudo=false
MESCTSENVDGFVVRVQHRLYGADRGTEDEDCVDPNLFDDEYDLAAATGFTRVWAGSRVMLDFLKESSRPSLTNKKVLDLGSGAGLLGLCCAAMGSSVLMTDVKPVVEDILRVNLEANSGTEGERELQEEGGSYAAACPSSSGAMGRSEQTCGAKAAWPGAVAVGSGSALALPLDWKKDVREQVASFSDLKAADFASVETILAAECVWLKELLQPFVRTLKSLLMLCENAPLCLVSFVERGREGSETFTTRAEFLTALTDAGCTTSLEWTGEVEEPDDCHSEVQGESDQRGSADDIDDPMPEKAKKKIHVDRVEIFRVGLESIQSNPSR